MSCGEFGCVALQPSRVRRAQDEALDVCGGEKKPIHLWWGYRGEYRGAFHNRDRGGGS